MNTDCLNVPRHRHTKGSPECHHFKLITLSQSCDFRKVLTNVSMDLAKVSFDRVFVVYFYYSRLEYKGESSLETPLL